MAAAAASIGSLFRPLQNENQPPIPQNNFREVELLPHLTTEAILATGITWDDLRRFLKNKQVRMALGVYICSNSNRFDIANRVLVLGAPDDSAGLNVRVRSGTATETAMAACNFLVRLLAASEKSKVYLYGHTYGRSLLLPVSGPTLSYLFEHSQEHLIKVTLGHAILSEEHLRVLAISPRHERQLELVLQWCRFADNDACREASVQWLQSDGGPTELDGCHIDSHVLANSLRGNSRLSILRLPSMQARRDIFGCDIPTDPDRGLIFSAFAENKGLTVLYASGHSIGEEDWSILCQSLQKHPALTRVDLTDTGPMSSSGQKTLLAVKQKTRRTRELAEMMQTNTILCTIRLSEKERDKKIYTKPIQPRLIANRYRLRVLAVKKEADDRPFRQKVLGRALHRVRRNPNLVWMFLSGNVDAFVQEQEGTSNSEVAVAVLPEAVVGTHSKRKRCIKCLD
jgi:hypothetical protein